MSKGVDRRFFLCKKKQFFLNGEVYSLTKGLLMDDPLSSYTTASLQPRALVTLLMVVNFGLPSSAKDL
jgi:hypothetical protein